MNTKIFILIKGYVSGIQDFIFNIESKKAAKALKARSFFIEAICFLALEKIKNVFPDIQILYIGGGNFYLELAKDKWAVDNFLDIKKEFLTYFKETQLSLNISYIQIDNNKTYGEWVGELNKIANREKYTKYNIANHLFEPFNKTTQFSQSDFVDLSNNLFRSKSILIVEHPPATFNEIIDKDSISLFDHKLILKKDDSGKMVFPNIPIWNSDLLNEYQHIVSNYSDDEDDCPKNNTVINFNQLADFAKDRTGTGKIGVLKLDVDNLGSLFQQLKGKNDYKLLSENIKKFFSVELTKLLDSDFIYTKRDGDDIQTEPTEGRKKIKYYNTVPKRALYKNNIYVIFAGGDDCFLIGGWDAIIEFAIALNNHFKEFEQEIRKELIYLTKPITFSAAILMVNKHFPVAKIADLAEERLHMAKTFLDDTGTPVKNNVSFMGKIFSWDELDTIREVKDKFHEMIIKYDEHKSFIQKIIYMFETDTTYWKKQKKPFNPAILWRFLYQFRDMVEKEYFKKYFFNFFFDKSNGLYESEVKNNFHQKKESNKLPVAARWTELLTRKRK